MVYKWRIFIELMDPLLNIMMEVNHGILMENVHRTDGPALESADGTK